MKYSNVIVYSLLLLTMIECYNQKTANNNNNASKSNENIITSVNPSHPNNPYYSHTDTTSLRSVPLSKWKKILPTNVFNIAFKRGTDNRYKGYWNFKGKGIYYCGVCGNKLFASTAKFASTCGWPSFFKPVKGAVEYRHDDRHNMHRIEVICKRCGAHLGHVFDDGPPPTGLRFCMNSSVLDFVQDSSVNSKLSNEEKLNYKQIILKIDNK